MIPFNTSCGKCHHCKEEEYVTCDNSNPNVVIPDKFYSQAGAEVFGYSHMMD